jgi:hypothetical protein
MDGWTERFRRGVASVEESVMKVERGVNESRRSLPERAKGIMNQKENRIKRRKSPSTTKCKIKILRT